MGLRRFLPLVALICVFCLCHGRRDPEHQVSGHAYNHTIAVTLAEYASAVYMTDLTALAKWTCTRCNDLTKGFKVEVVIVDVQHCLQAFVGVDCRLNGVIVAIRGTQENSIQNWIEDLLWKQLDLEYPDAPDAMVHSGFFSAYNDTILRTEIIKAVRRARAENSGMGIFVTGHSMGGAMASFCALDLVVNHGVQNLHLTTFGQPRVGNAAFASYFEKRVPWTFRVTHARDIVPHLPPHFRLFPKSSYRHFPREVWLHNTGIGSLVEQVCDGSGEDPTCSASVWICSISDHFSYFGLDMEADDWSSCRITHADTHVKLGTTYGIVMSMGDIAHGGVSSM